MEDLDDDECLAALGSCNDLFSDPFDDELSAREADLPRIEEGFAPQQKEHIQDKDTVESKVEISFGEQVSATASKMADCNGDAQGVFGDLHRQSPTNKEVIEKECEVEEERVGLKRLLPLRRRTPVAKFRFHRVSLCRLS